MSNSEFYKNLIEQTKSKESPDAFGCFKDCYFIDNYAVLKSLTSNCPVKPNERQLVIARLKKLGLKTPSIVYYTTIRDNYIEVQDRAQGNVLYKNTVYMPPNTMTEDEIREYNKDRTIQLLSVPVEHFKDYAKSIFIGTQYCVLNDNHSNNVLYDEENGFSFIDLPDNLPNINLKELKERINLPLKRNGEYFAKRLFSPFNQCNVRDGRVYRNTIINNLFNHKILDGLNLAIKEFSPSIQKNVFNENTRTCIEETLLSSIYSLKVEDDLNTKFHLIHFGIIKPNQQEKEFLKTIDEPYSPEIPDELLEFYYSRSQDSEESIDFLKKCVDVSTINNLSACEYFTNLDASNIIDNYKEQSKTYNFDNDDFEL